MTSIRPGVVVWFTGLSGSGKSSLCDSVGQAMIKANIPAQAIDADVFRRRLSPDLGFDLTARRENIERISYVAELLVTNGINVLVAAITPLREMRSVLRGRFVNYVEVFTDAPLSVCELRDPKGLYRRARAGEIKEFTGIDSVFEAPVHAHITCRTAEESLEQSTSTVLSYLTKIFTASYGAAVLDVGECEVCRNDVLCPITDQSMSRPLDEYVRRVTQCRGLLSEAESQL